MKFLRLAGVLVASYAIAGCAVSPRAACTISDAGQLLVQNDARGVRLRLPADAKGPSYESDDYSASRPTWTGANWTIHFVYGNGGLTEFMKGDRCCSLDDNEMHRTVCVGEYIYYGAMADISRVASPDKVSSVQVTIEPKGITENEALKIIASMVTTWEKQ